MLVSSTSSYTFAKKKKIPLSESELTFSPDQFGVSPGVHVQDLTYTFNNPIQPAPFKKAQDALQNAVVSFVQTGVAKYEEGRPFPVWGSERDIVNITSSGGELSQSRVNTTRCAWWRDFEG
jgi:hypothetical protein